jgi:hypothetical protein
MKGRVRIKGNGTYRVVEEDEKVYEGRQKRRTWEVESSVRVEGRKGNTGKYRPHYCYKEGNERTVSGTCRMCRVEREGRGTKPVPACTLPVGTGRSVWTETPRVQKVREGVRERRLRNHPLDCPICDQGGECDLQEQTREYGNEGSRRQGKKRAVEDKERGGPLKRVMTRCIHCTRCVRGSGGERGLLGRGRETEIGMYRPWKGRESRTGGKLVERCPVGARTGERGKFKVRPWERKVREREDIRDVVGAPLSVKIVGGEVVSVIGKRWERGESVGDKTRYGYDGRQKNRRREVVRESGEERRGKVSERGESGVKRRVGTGVDQELLEERKRGERRGEREREGLGVGKRGERRRNREERTRERTKELRERRVVLAGRNRGKERPVLEGYRKGGRGKAREKSRSGEVIVGNRGGEKRSSEGRRKEGRPVKKRGRGVEQRGRRVGGKVKEGKARRGESGRRVLGGGRRSRGEGKERVKRKGRVEKGREESGEYGEAEQGVKRRRHTSNSRGRSSRG